MNIRRKVAGIALLMTVTIVLFDSRVHFDAELITLKRNHNSAQRNWNLFYGQQYVYQDSSLRYRGDFAELAKLIKPGSAILADLPTSYYSAASLAVYPFNIHRHHGRFSLTERSQLLSTRVACSMDQAEPLAKLQGLIKKDQLLSEARQWPKWRYILLNNDTANSNLSADCLWRRRFPMQNNIETIADKVYDGDYLSLYKVKEL